MSKKTTYLLGILLTIIIGTLLYCYLCDSCYCCPKEETEPTKVITNAEANPKVITVTRNAFAITEPNGDFKLNVNDNFNFKTSSFSILDSVSPKVISGVSKLKDFLLKNPLKTVNITGFYQKR